MSWEGHSHKKVLEAIMKCCDIKSVFEFGSGLGSTPIFLERSSEVHSVEMQSEEWFQTVQKELGHNEHFKYEIKMGPIDTIIYFSNLGKRYDLVFVDGHGSSRPECINEAFKFTNIVVTHDTETPSYGWSRIVKPEGWTRLDYMLESPWTTIFFNESLDVTELRKELNI